MSNKKTLLNEATIRRFMKLANMEAVGDDFISNFQPLQEKSCGSHLEEEEMEEGYGHDKKMKEGDYKMEEMEEMEEMMDYAREDEEEEMDIDLEDVADVEVADEAPAAGMEEKVEELVSAIADAIEASTGVSVDVEGDAGEEMEMELEDEVEVEPEMPEEEPEMPEMDEPEMAQEAQTFDQEAIVQEVMKRVAARLLKNRSK